MKMTPEHHRAVAAVWNQSDHVDYMERQLRWHIRKGAGWMPLNAQLNGQRIRCVFCSNNADGYVESDTLCASCLREHAGSRWAIVAMLRAPALGERPQ